jgi:macrodomain Ter protein organizer (MatP/YcbG family)
MNDRFRVLQRQPRRISITLSYFVHESLLSRSEEEGRSVSNLCAFLLEDALRDQQREGQQPLPVMPHSHGPMGNGRVKTHSF